MSSVTAIAVNPTSTPVCSLADVRAGSDHPTDDIITVHEVAQILKCKPSSVYNLTRKRSRRYTHPPIPVIRLPLGLRFRRSSVLAWLAEIESAGQGIS
jgi:predicted DNA-binding transcriptional regulator AlpA